MKTKTPILSDSEVLALIQKYDIAVRMIPYESTSTYRVNMRHSLTVPRTGDVLKFLTGKNCYPTDPAGAEYWDTKFPDGVWHLSRTTSNKFGGQWMAQKGSTGSTVQWDIKKHHLSTTIGEAVQKCVNEIEEQAKKISWTRKITFEEYQKEFM